ncbi:hypothetical protein DFH07DRAFT_797263 [Mycena maculata]|uniref:Uncharacterized protein n=1 Tax=Mycena maculata TaxID=230809 RepID=A0AAD7NW67_9AGAR|nr:hypothetical protein DFH07DRAFT_797263 [Mycena maculata]
MSSPLTDWTKAQFSALYAPTNVQDPEHAPVDQAAQLQTDFDATFSPDADIRLNHTVVDREKFKEFVKSRRSLTAQVECRPEDLIETPVEGGNAEAGSIVAGKVTLVRTYPFRIRAAAAKTSTVIIFSAKIQPNPKPQIVQLFQTSVDKSFQINLPTARHVDASEL